ncbi:hypothetical protein BPAE_0015g00820 [Botrytis paeoniae]|uniref:Uncharacterized protein n=1 Tax=Botrytis paeoniae TaxID=278948 RepID=A0A4Z1G0H4_9HELO|nr:hypothetical protein BPAE_0015g00820 [Botrytis paeoniae]
MASRGGQSEYEAVSARSKRPDPSEKAFEQYERGGDGEEEREKGKTRERRERRKHREHREDRDGTRERDGRRDRDKSQGRSSIAKKPTRSLSPSNNNSVYSHVPPSDSDSNITWTQDPIDSDMSTVSDDQTVYTNPLDGGRRMQSVVKFKLRTGTSRSGRLEAPPSPSGETKSHKSDSRKGKEHDVKSKHSARPQDTEGPVEPFDSVSNVSYPAPPPNVTVSSTRTPLPQHSEVSIGSRSVNHRSDNGKGKEHKVKSNHGARSRDSEAPSQFSDTSSYKSESSVFPASTIMSPPAHSQVPTGSRPAKHRSDKGKEREHKSNLIQKSSNHGSGIPEVAEKMQYKYPLTKPIETQYKVPINWQSEGTSEDSNQNKAATWTPIEIKYAPKYTVERNRYFTHK